MIPEDKSRELIDKYKVYSETNGLAKQCAIICVEQIIIATGADKDENNGYWQRVLEYIKNS